MAWFLDNTLQSNIQLFGAGLLLATERPTLEGSVSKIFLSSNGWELGLEVRIAIAIFHYKSCWTVQRRAATGSKTGLRMRTNLSPGLDTWQKSHPH